MSVKGVDQSSALNSSFSCAAGEWSGAAEGTRLGVERVDLVDSSGLCCRLDFVSEVNGVLV